jgi:hypothetical protein
LHQIAPERFHPPNAAWLKLIFFGIIARHSARSFNKAFYDAMFPASTSRSKSDD